MLKQFLAASSILILFLSGCTGELPPIAVQPAVTDLDAYPWVYLRDGRPLEADEQVVSVIAVGDTLLGRGISDEADPLQEAAGWLSDADIALANLEGVLVDSGTARPGLEGEPQPILLGASPDATGHLVRAGFDIMSLANNHSLDYGEEGLLESVNHLQEASIDVLGLMGEGVTADPLIREVDGLRLAFLAFNAVGDPHPELVCPPDGECSPRPAIWDPLASAKAIAKARAAADAVIVSIHWGFEYQSRPDPGQERIAHALLDAGADLIVGHHPHVPQDITIQENRVIAFSLGNFLFDQGQGETAHGVALRPFFDKKGLRALQALPLQAGPRPRIATMAEAKTWLSQLLPPVSDADWITYVCEVDGCTVMDAPPTDEADPSADGRFFSGQIDLTGDGNPETVRREGEQIKVYEEGAAVWESPPAWRVMNVALGDPNDDGRYEIALAIHQKDAAGYDRSQPYLVGYRGGHYDLLWGGRPLADPIQELAVGDVDGDGIDELVVIEELADGSAQALSVWRWSGWTFTLVWRSEHGSFTNLALWPDGQKHLISIEQS
jgi:poly-gamma-glutamate synthesis protein (capsule biosynthesis protein)